MANKNTKTKTNLNYTIESIDSSLLEVLREDYQKPLNEKRVSQIVAEFDENIANEPKVSYRDGHYYVFDGQHTLAARIMLNKGKPVKVRCKVYRELSEKDEAVLFAAQTGFAAKPTPGNTLLALLFAEDEESISFCEAMPCNIELSGIESSMFNAMSREFILKAYVDQVRKNYDYKPNQKERFRFSFEKSDSLFPRDISEKEAKDYLLKALEHYKKFLLKQREQAR